MNKIIDLNTILDIVCQVTNVDKQDVITKKRQNLLVTCRYVFCYIAYEYGYTIPETTKHVNIGTADYYWQKSNIEYRIITNNLYRDIYYKTKKIINDLRTSLYHNINE